MKKYTSFLLAAMLCFALSLPCFAARADFLMTVSADKTSVTVGERIKVSLSLKANGNAPFDIYAMQNYVIFDTEYFSFVEDSLSFADGFTASVREDRVFVNRYGSAMEFDGGTVVSFELEAVDDGTPDITQSGGEMIDGSGDSIKYYTLAYKNAKVVITEAETEEETETEAEEKPDTSEDDDFEADEPLYRIVLSEGEGGSCEISDSRAAKGERIYVYPYADEGFSVDGVAVTDSRGKSVKVTERADGSYAFTMPGSRAYVDVTFKEEEKPTETETTESISEETEAEDKTPTATIHICPSKPYTDVDITRWYHEAVDYAISYNIMNGYDEHTFAPLDTTTRAMIAVMLWRLDGAPVSSAEIPFSDVSDTAWYADALRWTAEKGIVNGVGGDMFAPDGVITREQLLTMIYRYEQYRGGGFKGLWAYRLKFPDLASISDWAIEAVSWCNMKGIINGDANGNLNPGNDATRAETAKIIMNYKSMNK